MVLMSDSLKLFKIDDIDFSQLKFSNVRGKTGRRFTGVFYDKKILQIVLPKLRLPFAANLSKFGSLEFNLSLDSRQNLVDSFKKLDENMVKFAKENNWFQNDDFKYIPVLKDENKNYPPYIKLKIAKKDGDFVTRIYDHEKKEVPITRDSDVLDVLQKGNMVISLIEFAGVWFNNINGVESFGVFWKVDHIRVYPVVKENQIDDYMFEDSEPELDEYLFTD